MESYSENSQVAKIVFSQYNVHIFYHIFTQLCLRDDRNKIWSTDNYKDTDFLPITISFLNPKKILCQILYNII